MSPPLPTPPKQRRHVEGHRDKMALRQKEKQRKDKEDLRAQMKDYERRRAQEAWERDEYARRVGNTDTISTGYLYDDVFW